MGLYGPRFSLPSLPDLPKPNLETMKRPLLAIIGLLVILAIAYVAIPMISNAGTGLFSNHTGVGWINNPLDLTHDGVYEADLLLTLTNTTDTLTTITLDVTSDSSELIIFCPYKTFPNVAPGNSRKTTCLIRRDPKLAIFSGSYTINVETNLGKTNTVLQVIAN